MSFINMAKSFESKSSEPERDSTKILLAKAEETAFTKDGFPVLLDIMAKTGYTVRNSMLVMAQNRSVSLLKSFDDWKKAGRSIKKGATGIRISVPNESGESMFRIESVFDVSQTEGKEEYVVTPRHARLVSSQHISAVNSSVLRKVSADSVELIADCPKPIFFDLRKNALLISNTITDEQAFPWMVRSLCVGSFKKLSPVRELLTSGEALTPLVTNYIDFMADATAYVASKSVGLSFDDFDVSRVETLMSLFGDDKKAYVIGMQENLSIIYADSTCLLDDMEKNIRPLSKSKEPEKER